MTDKCESTSSVDSSDMFICTQCGDCCKGYGGTYVTQKDIKAIASYIGKTPEEVFTRYCRMSGKKPVLAQRDDGYCIFWDKLCTIHPVKPKMCRAWPYIESIRIDVNNWFIMAGSCPGMKTDFTESQIRECIEKELSEFSTQE